MPAKAIKDYLALHFKEEQAKPNPLITEAEIEQLTWAVRPGQTPEKAITDNQRHDLLEVRRCLSRLYNLELLLQGGSTFDAFIAVQEKNNPLNPPLAKEHYLALTQKFANLDPLTTDTLRVTTILTAFPLSPKARENADRVLGKNNYKFDSVEFLADTVDDIEKAKAIYPVVHDLFEKYPKNEDRLRITKLIQSALSHRRHYRHMMYTEGNENMYHGLIDAIRSGKLDKEAYEFWKLHWTVNIAGFRGNESVKGSNYLTHNTFMAMNLLENLLDKIETDPLLTPREILTGYLRSRAAFLGLERFKKLAPEERKLLAHVGSMMRMYTPQEGKFLAIAVGLMPKNMLVELSKAYFDSEYKQKPTPTYVPAFFQNAKDKLTQLFKNELIMRLIKEMEKAESELEGGHLKEINPGLIESALTNAVMIVACLPLYLSALSQYNAKWKKGEIANGDPLSFRLCAGKESIENLFPKITESKEWNLFEVLEPIISEKGEVSFVAKPKPEIVVDLLSKSETFIPLKASKDNPTQTPAAVVDKESVEKREGLTSVRGNFFK